MRLGIVPTGLYSEQPDPAEPTVRDLCARPDAEETFARIAAGLPVEHPEPELVTTLTALAVLRARDAAERLA